MEINVQTNHIDGLARGLIESALVRLNHEAAAAGGVELMSAEVTTLPCERCSFSLEVGIELSRKTDETWEVESGKCPTQAEECDLKPTEELPDLKLRCAKQDNLNCMYVQTAEAEMPSHGIPTLFVEDEQQGDPDRVLESRGQLRSERQTTEPILN